MDRYQEIEKITKMHIKQQNQFLRFFSRTDLETKLRIMQTQREIFHILKNLHKDKDIDNATLTYSSLVISISAERKNSNSNAKIFKAKKFRRSSKKEKILEKWAIVKSLKNDEKLSFRQISQYLKKYHRLDISYSLIYRLWIEIEEKKYEKGEQKDG